MKHSEFCEFEDLNKFYALPWLMLDKLFLGSPQQRIEYGTAESDSFSSFVELMKYFSSIVNPIIYPAIFGRLRSDIVRLLVRRKKSAGLPRKQENFEAQLMVRKSTLNEKQCNQCFDDTI